MEEEEAEVQEIGHKASGLLANIDPENRFCCICYEKTNLSISKCKHIACGDCWDNWLSKYLECP